MNPITKSLLKLTLVACLLSCAVAQSTAQDAPRLLPFQGRLTDQNGVPVSNSVKLVQFKIYDQPSAGNTVWAGEVHRATINGGLVNVLLGTKTPLPSTTSSDEHAFNRQLYLEITVDINGDDVISAADPPMLPRQLILPALFAKESDDSRKLGGLPAAELLAMMKNLVPVGAIMPFYGNPASLPPTWALCDGRVLSDPQSPFDGQAMPDLRETFLRGASDASALGTTGGRDFSARHKHRHDHTHGFKTDDSFLDESHVWNVFLNWGGGHVLIGGYSPNNSTTPLRHSHTGTTRGPSTEYTEDDYTSDTDPGLDNRPRFFSVHYIIRIR